MANAYHELLNATIAHLEELQEQGVKFVSVSPATMNALAAPSRFGTNRAARPTAPVSAARPARRPTAPTAAPQSAPPTEPASAPPTSEKVATFGKAPTGFQRSLSLEGARRSLTPEEKVAAMEALRRRVLPCRKCEHLANSRQNVVFGVGSPNAELMFIGEAPGADEDAQAEPFVGKAGQLLTRIIQTMSLSRETVYIANILKCRPDTPGQASGNRKPTPSEMATCLPYLLEQIDLIQPKVLVALGATAVEGLFGKSEGITRLRGHWLTFRDTPVMPTYHPAYLLRNQALPVKRQVWEDMLAVMEKLGMPISSKQQNYFLKP